MNKQELCNKIRENYACHYLSNDPSDVLEVLQALDDLDDKSVMLEDAEFPIGCPEIIVWEAVEYTFSVQDFLDRIEDAVNELTFSTATLLTEVELYDLPLNFPSDVENIVVFRDNSSNALFSIDSSWYDQVYEEGDVIPSPYNYNVWLELIESE